MIKQLSILNLFGRFDYPLIFKNGGVTILTGPNGFGKSTILDIINAISKSDLNFFFNLDFGEIEFQFDDDSILKLRKSNEKLYIDDIVLTIPSAKDYNLFSLKPHIYPRYEDYYKIAASQALRGEKVSDYLDIIDFDFLRDKEFPAIMFSNLNAKQTAKLKSKLKLIQQQCGKVRLISEQRLIQKKNNEDNQEIIDSITELPKKLKKEISKVTEEYSKVANKLDSSYPRRLLTANAGLSSIDEYNEKLKEANNKFMKLSEYNLVHIQLLDSKNYDEKYSTALMIYFEDFTSKYKVFEELIAKLDLFTDIINHRLSFKKLKISSQNGFNVVDIDDSKKDLDLSKLSSGEKQEIVLFYELIFNVDSELLLLIDEPEISLHITWQKKFLEDLLRVTKRSELEVIVATHSPQIINNNWDLQIDLGEIYGK